MKRLLAVGGSLCAIALGCMQQSTALENNQLYGFLVSGSQAMDDYVHSMVDGRKYSALSRLEESLGRDGENSCGNFLYLTYYHALIHHSIEDTHEIVRKAVKDTDRLRLVAKDDFFFPIYAQDCSQYADRHLKNVEDKLKNE